MALNQKRFKTSTSPDLERVFATHVGNTNTPATGEVVRLQQGWDSMGMPFYIAMDGSEWISSDEFEVGTSPTRVMLGSEVLNIGSSPTAFQSIPTFAKSVEINVMPSSEGIAWVTSGTLDIANKNFRATSAGGSILLRGSQEVQSFLVTSLADNGVSVGAGSNLYAEYFNIDKEGNYVTYLDNTVDVVVEWIGDLAGFTFENGFIGKADGLADGYESKLQNSLPVDLLQDTILEFEISPVGVNHAEMHGLVIGFDSDHEGLALETVEHGFLVPFQNNWMLRLNSTTSNSPRRLDGLSYFVIRRNGSTFNLYGRLDVNNVQSEINMGVILDENISGPLYLSIAMFNQKMALSNIQLNGLTLVI